MKEKEGEIFSSPSKNTTNIQPHPHSPSTFSYPMMMMPLQSPMCPICRHGGADLRILPCGHAFHRTCLEHFLVKTQVKNTEPQCPLCTQVIRQQQPLSALPPQMQYGLHPAQMQQFVAMMQPSVAPPKAVRVVNNPPPEVELRRGKWTDEEEAYANALMVEFQSGKIPVQEGMTLRNFLAKLLQCDPMRISKKYVGANCIGKQVYRSRPDEAAAMSEEEKTTNRTALLELETKFRERIQVQYKKRMKRRKAQDARTAAQVKEGGEEENIDDDGKELETKAGPTSTPDENTLMAADLQNTAEYLSKIPSVDSFTSLMIPRPDSMMEMSSLYAFPRVQSFDQMLRNPELLSSISTESFSSLLPRVGSLERMAASDSSEMLLVKPRLGLQGKGIPPGGLPRVPSLDKGLNALKKGKSSANASLVNLATFAEGMSRESSFQNLEEYMSRPSSEETALDAMNQSSSSSALQNFQSKTKKQKKTSEKEQGEDTCIPRNSSIDDILAYVDTTGNAEVTGSTAEDSTQTQSDRKRPRDREYLV